MLLRTVIFLVLNFGALAIGGIFTRTGVPSDWYQSLNKAPWTPPGWVFGSAWTVIMICFAIYMSYAWKNVNNRNVLITLFAIQWFLNVLWNPVFFKFHQILPGLIIITILTILIGYFLFSYGVRFKAWSLLIMPYFIWLLIATSLNAYIYLTN